MIASAMALAMAGGVAGQAAPTGQLAFVLPASTTMRNITVCPGGNRIAAEFAFADGQIAVVAVSGDRRTADARDRAAMTRFFQPLRSMDAIVIACQRDGSAFVTIRGVLSQAGVREPGMLTMRWGRRGFSALP